MTREWHCSRDGEDFGSVPSAELKQLVVAGRLLRTDLPGKEGMTGWKPSDTVPGFFPL